VCAWTRGDRIFHRGRRAAGSGDEIRGEEGGRGPRCCPIPWHLDVACTPPIAVVDSRISPCPGSLSLPRHRFPLRQRGRPTAAFPSVRFFKLIHLCTLLNVTSQCFVYTGASTRLLVSSLSACSSSFLRARWSCLLLFGGIARFSDPIMAGWKLICKWEDEGYGERTRSGCLVLVAGENSGWSSVTVGPEVKQVSTKSNRFQTKFLINACLFKTA